MTLNQAVVLDAAVALLDETGLDELTTRKLATRLGVRVGALYWHYANKQALMDAIAEHILDDAAATDLPSEPWKEHVAAFARAHREAMLRHPDGARIIAMMGPPGPAAKAFISKPIDVMTAAGLTLHQAMSCADVITSYVNGYTVEEQARKSSVDRALRDAGFEAGVAVIVAGIGTLVTGS